jgi:dihydrolipoamide dehydrogenase
MNDEYDVAVIGAGPGGYVAAIRAGQLGLRTVVIEQENLGGECLNHGCIPSKALIHAAESYAGLAELKTFGVTVEGAALDWAAAVAWKDRIVKRLTGGVATLLKAAGVEVVVGRARFVDSHTLAVTGPESERAIHARHVILAVGSQPFEVPGLPFDGRFVISSREALKLTAVPPRLIVVGGGYIGLEMGTVFAMAGAAVTVVELLDGLLPGHSRDAVKVLDRGLRRLKVKALVNTKAAGLEIVGDVARLTVEGPGGARQTLDAEKILVTVGRKPRLADLGLENTGVRRNERWLIEVDAARRTADPAIFAIGDITPGPALAHKASAEGLVAAAAIAGQPAAFQPKGVPSVAFTLPEVASVGVTKERAAAEGIDADDASFPYLPLGRALTMGASDGYFKWTFARSTGAILGCEIVGREASNLIGEAALAIEKGLTLSDVAATIHPHPTLGEGLHEAAELGLGWPVHLPKK